MIKSELVQLIATAIRIFTFVTSRTSSAPFSTKSPTRCAEGNRVELRGFGAFSVKNRPARTGRNPRTGDICQVEEKWVPFFKTGKEMRERLNEDRGT